MATFGSIALALGVCVSAYAAIASIAGIVTSRPELVISGRRAIYMAALIATAAIVALLIAFITNDFSIRYVFQNSNLAMGRGYTFVALYAANEGSLLYLAFALAVMATISARFAPKRFADALPYTIAILGVVLCFFFAVMALLANPFATLDTVPADGRGINPLLLHPGFYSHPPMIMAGLIGIVIPFAFSTGALISGRYSDDWVDLARVFAIIMWALLGIGMLLGAWWAYTILGWGGYWSWDPIENVALMPWLALTAFIHSIMVQRRRGMFRMWNIALIDIALLLALLGVFINRGGPVVSVHSFASSTLGFVFLAFMIANWVFAFAVFLWRLPQLQSERAVESFLSREASFLVNNFLLLLVTAVTLWGVIYPVFSDLARDVDVTVAAPYFNRVNGPVLLTLVILMGIGPLLPWRRANPRSLRKWLIAPAATALILAAVLFASGIAEPWAIVGFAATAFAFVAVLEEWTLGARARMRNLGEVAPVAWWRLVNGNRARHGGYIVHIAILVFAIGVIGTQFFDQRFDAAIAEGESLVIDNYRVEFTDSRLDDRPDRVAQWAILDVYRIDPSEYIAEFESARSNGRSGFVTDGNPRASDRYIGELQPQHEFHRAANQVAVRAGIQGSPLEDLYVIPRDFLSDGRISLAVSINPLAMWLWIAGPIFILGTAIALWPNPVLERAGSRSASRVRATSDQPVAATPGAAS